MFSFIFKFLALTPSSQSAHPLLQVSEIIESNIELYVQDGQLMVQSPSNPNVFFPFRDPIHQLAPKPQSNEGWTLVPTDCSSAQSKIELSYTYLEDTYTAEATQDKEGLRIYWKQGDTLLAEQLIMQQAVPCAIHILDADASPGLEMVVAWQFSPELKGFTIFKIPDTAVLNTPAP